MKRLLIIILLIPFLVSASEQIDLNTASMEELDKIIGIGPAMAKRIIDARPFSSVDDLLKINGIGPVTLEKIKSQGLAYVSEIKNEINAEPAKVSEALIPPRDYPGNIFFIELMPSPQGNDEEGEYIKIKNGNEFKVNLEGYRIEDTIGTKSSYTLKEELEPAEVLKLTRSQTKIILNNSGDGLNLIDPTGKIIDSVTFENSKPGVPYIKTSSGWKWNVPAPKKESKISIKPGDTPVTETKASLAETEINLATSQPKAPVIAIALFTAILSGGFFLYFKNKMG